MKKFRNIIGTDTLPPVGVRGPRASMAMKKHLDPQYRRKPIIHSETLISGHFATLCSSITKTTKMLETRYAMTPSDSLPQAIQPARPTDRHAQDRTMRHESPAAVAASGNAAQTMTTDGRNDCRESHRTLPPQGYPATISGNIERRTVDGVAPPARLWQTLAWLCLGIMLSVFLPRPAQALDAALPMVHQVPPSQPTAIDGVWRIEGLNKRIRIESGRAYAVDGWLHAFILQVKPGMVVVKDIRPDAVGGFSGYDLPLLGAWSATPTGDGTLDVKVAGALGPAGFRLHPAASDPVNPGYGQPPPQRDQPDYDYEQPRPTPPPIPGPGEIGRQVGDSIADLGRNCLNDFKPMGSAMLKYFACQQGLGRFNALKKAVKANNADDAMEIVKANACSNELNDMVSTLRSRGFKSFSVGVSGEVSIGVGGNGEYMIAMDIDDLGDPTLYATIGAGIGVQMGGAVGGVVSAHYKSADQLSGGGKSFAASLHVAGGGGGAVGISNGRSPRCESFSATAGVGGLANSGSVSATYTAKIIAFPSPDFTPSCKDVVVQAKNRTGKQIKIVDVDFYDYENKRWRSKVVKNTKIAHGKNWTKRFRLQKVGGDKTRVRIQYRIRDNHSPLNPWSKVIDKKTSAKTCEQGSRFSAVLK
jgi:hypothetical protein